MIANYPTYSTTIQSITIIQQPLSGDNSTYSWETENAIVMISAYPWYNWAQWWHDVSSLDDWTMVILMYWDSTLYGWHPWSLSHDVENLRQASMATIIIVMVCDKRMLWYILTYYVIWWHIRMYYDLISMTY